MQQNLSPDANGLVLTSIFLIYDIALTCPEGWTLVSGSAKLTGWASNYFGGIETAVLTITLDP